MIVFQRTDENRCPAESALDKERGAVHVFERATCVRSASIVAVLPCAAAVCNVVSPVVLTAWTLAPCCISSLAETA